jgi:hypothetical protein
MSSALSPILALAISRECAVSVAREFSPLFPYLPPPGAKLNAEQAERLVHAKAEGVNRRAALLRHAGVVQRYLGWSYADLCTEARRIPKLIQAVAQGAGQVQPSADDLVACAQRMYELKVPGTSTQSRLARILDPKFWRRTLWRRIVQERERLHLELGLVGKGGSSYCSDDALAMRRTQIEAQRRWLKETTLCAITPDGECLSIPLEKVARSAHQKMSRLYAFIAAMDKQAAEAGLTVALLTATLEGEWHANPSHATTSHRWNGKGPGAANEEMGSRFQKIRRDLAKRGVHVSGLWAAEPHKDGCPHRHFWVIYAPENEPRVFATFLKYFPDKLKLRRDAGAGGDKIYDNADSALEGISRPLRRANEGAQIDVSIIDRSKGSGASYVLKYVQKAIVTDVTYKDLTTPVDGAATPPRSTYPKKVEAELKVLQSIDAYRAVWRIRSFQFFGIRNCLSLWDELRRLKQRPTEARLRELWHLARGGDTEGSMNAEQQRGDADGFLKALGGLAAVQPIAQLDLCEERVEEKRAKLYRSPTTTRYGERGVRIEGVELVDGTRKSLVLERMPTRATRWILTPSNMTASTGSIKSTSGIVSHSDPRSGPDDAQLRGPATTGGSAGTTAV